MKKEELFAKISCQTGKMPVQCCCERCKAQCHTPCLGTPHDILALIDAGYAWSLCFTEWAAGVTHRMTDKIIPMVQIKERFGWCVLYHDGLCELHEKGLKPTEGRLSSHEFREIELQPEYNVTYQVAATWLDDSNLNVVQEIVRKLGEYWDSTKTNNSNQTL